jgi:HD-GYP domain-containing protein (c-di-GMP phosphodiesterase class II)
MQSDSLVVGRTLRLPIYNDDGLLLLAEGMAITPEFRHKLLDQKLTTVKIHPEEVLNVSSSDPLNSSGYAGDEELGKRLVEIVDENFLTVVNSEPELIGKVVRHGTENYVPQKHQGRVEQNLESSRFLDAIMQDAIEGKEIDFSQIARMTSRSILDISDDIDSSIASMVDTMRHDVVADHCVKMSLLGMAIGIEMHLDAPNLRNLSLAGLVHDWGMLSVPPEIRNAKRILTEEERLQVTKHPIHTYRLLRKIRGVPYDVSLVAYQVHECPNGRGYPQGDTGDRIHIMARILSVADRYHALVSPRPFRPPLTPYAAMECLLRQAAAGDVDPDVVRALLLTQSLFPIGSYVVLSDGSTARVLRRNGNNFSHPIVRIVIDSQGKEVPEESQSAIVDLSTSGLKVAQSLPNPGSNAVSLSPQILKMRDDVDNEDEMLHGELGSCLASKAKDDSDWEWESIPSLENYTETQKRIAHEAIDILDNSAQITDRSYQRVRNDNRVALRTVATICMSNSQNPIVDFNSNRLLRVLTRDVSSRGVSFVCPDELPRKQVLIGLQVNDQKIKWFQSDIVRVRPIGDTGFWEHGAVFRKAIAT